MKRRAPTSIRMNLAEEKALDELTKRTGRSRSLVIARLVAREAAATAPPPPLAKLALLSKSRVKQPKVKAPRVKRSTSNAAGRRKKAA